MKMNRTFLSLVLIIIFSVSCNNSAKVKIGYLVPNSTSERYKKEQTYFQQKINALGGEAIFASADFNDKLQIQQANEMISQGVTVLVVSSVNMNTAAAIVRNAHKSGVSVIAYDRLIKNSDLDYYISFDNIKVGKLMAEYATKLKPEGNYILLGGDKADLNAVLVKNGQLEVLSKFISAGKIKISYNVFVEEWSGENASQELKRYFALSGETPDVILSSYDGMSIACSVTLEEEGLSGVILTGQDAELEACRNIIADRQTMTIYKSLKALSEKAAEIAFKMASHQKFEAPKTSLNNGYKDVPSILLEPIVVDKSNIKNTLIADGFYTEAQLYN